MPMLYIELCFCITTLVTCYLDKGQVISSVISSVSRHVFPHAVHRYTIGLTWTMFALHNVWKSLLTCYSEFIQISNVGHRGFVCFVSILMK